MLFVMFKFIICCVVFVLLVSPVDQRDRPFVKVHTQRERMRQGSYGVEGLCQLFFVEKFMISTLTK